MFIAVNKLRKTWYLRIQAILSVRFSVKPSLQEHLYLPRLFSHVCSQWFGRSHSLISKHDEKNTDLFIIALFHKT